jgi:protein O-GlcNAc transferase
MPSISETLQIALTYHRAGKLAEASNIYQQIIAVAPEHDDAWHLWGMAAHQQTNHTAALERIERAVALSGRRKALFLLSHGGVLMTVRRLEEARQSLEMALKIAPDMPEALMTLSQVCRHQGDNVAAIALLRHASHVRPNWTEALTDLGHLLQAEGDHKEAAICFERAVNLSPADGKIAYYYGLALKRQGEPDRAAEQFKRAIELQSNYVDAIHQLAQVDHIAGRLEAAHENYSHAIALQPNSAPILTNLGKVLFDQGKLADAKAAYDKAILCDPSFALAFNHLGAWALHSDQTYVADQFLKEAVRLAPDNAEILDNVGVVKSALGQFSSALEACERALQLAPQRADSHNNLGSILLRIGECEKASDEFLRARELRPDWVVAHDNFLLSQLYQDGVNLKKLFSLHADWYAQHVEVRKFAAPNWQNDRDTERVLRIGFVSADIGDHPIGYLLASLVPALDRREFKVYIYSNRHSLDQVGQTTKAATEFWRDIASESDECLTQTIQRDQIDILFDLSGHTARNRLMVFARRPAPVQVTWLGYPCTTGMQEIDYLLADPLLVPQDADEHFSEKIMRLPEGFTCLSLPDDLTASQPTAPPATRPFVFGSFNNPTKVNASVISTWAAIIRSVPESRLLLKFSGMNDECVKRRLSEQFAMEGVGIKQLEFRDRTPLKAMQSEYSEIDLALDPFPFGGGITTLLALRMGVPVITLPNETIAGRQTLSMLTTLGLSELVASDTNTYQSIATAMAMDRERLVKMRSEICQRFAESTFGNPKRFASSFSGALRTMWRAWCQRDN